MSYPMGLDEYTESALIAELENRREQRRRGLCDYCGRMHRAEPFCRMATRHAGTSPATMSAEQFHALNVERCEASTGFAHPFNTEHGWSVADWVVAVVGELGELANLLKKRRRGEDIADDLIRDEWADTYTYLDLLAEALGIVDPMPAVLDKFDRVSARIGWTGPEAVRVSTSAGSPWPDRRPHSRACAWREHPHGVDCAPDCPTCLEGMDL